MMIHEITNEVGKHKARKRVGRGRSSGLGKTSGRGHKGAKSRSGWKRRPYFEGGQMSLVRRLPKRGFSNVQFRECFHVVNVKTLETSVDDGAEVNVKMLAELGIVRDAELPLKILGEGDLKKKLNVTAAKFSGTAKEKIEGAGGTATVEAKVKWTRAVGKRPPKDKKGTKKS
jgi:large subunit ribosomal protein L15